MKKYQVSLYYGIIETDMGTYHSFELVDPNDFKHDDEIVDRLADMLSTNRADKDFDWNVMSLTIPPEVVQEIRDDAIEDYKDCVYADAY